MRNVLRSLSAPPSHAGLAYGTWAPVKGPEGKVPDAERQRWLESICEKQIDPTYAQAFERWKESFRDPADRVRELALESRLLVGHGNPSGVDIGITLHRTWGTPVIPGSALKGLLAHYMDTLFGSEDAGAPESEAPAAAGERSRYRGAVRRGARVVKGPGDVYRGIFGAPDAEEDDKARSLGLPNGAARGLVTFHDALYVPGSAPSDCPFAMDVITVHQKSYYDSAGGTWPNDYDDPNPVSFLTVQPGTRFLLALSGKLGWTGLVEELLLEALRDWGVGGKTTSGYGRLVPKEVARPRPVAVPGAASRATRPAAAGTPFSAPSRPRLKHRPGDRIEVTRVADPKGKGKIKFTADDGLLGHFVGEKPPDVEIGGKIQVWVANVGRDTYTLTLKDPKERRK